MPGISQAKSGRQWRYPSFAVFELPCSATCIVAPTREKSMRFLVHLGPMCATGRNMLRETGMVSQLLHAHEERPKSDSCRHSKGIIDEARLYIQWRTDLRVFRQPFEASPHPVRRSRSCTSCDIDWYLVKGHSRC